MVSEEGHLVPCDKPVAVEMPEERRAKHTRAGVQVIRMQNCPCRNVRWLDRDSRLVCSPCLAVLQAGVRRVMGKEWNERMDSLSEVNV